MEEKAERRPRNAAATRAAILEAATAAFTEQSYDTVGMRDIAARAGVDPALVNRYFGSKAGLFREVLDNFQRPDFGLDGPPDALIDKLVQGALENRSADPNPLLLLLRSSSSPQATAVVRESMQANILAPFAASLGGADSEQRALVATSVLVGLTVMGRILSPGPDESDPYAGSTARLLQVLKAALEP